MSFLRVLVPEEILALSQFLLLRMGCVNRLQSIGVVTRVEHLRRDGHRGGGKVLHLLKTIAHLTRNLCQLSHVSLRTTRVTGNEVGDNLLVEAFFAIDSVKLALEVEELLEGGLAHEHQDVVGSVLRSHFQTSADVAGDEFASVLTGSLVDGIVLAVMQQKVVAHTAADETLLDARQRVDSVIDIEEFGVVRI